MPPLIFPETVHSYNSITIPVILLPRNPSCRLQGHLGKQSHKNKAGRAVTLGLPWLFPNLSFTYTLFGFKTRFLFCVMHAYYSMCLVSSAPPTFSLFFFKFGANCFFILLVLARVAETQLPSRTQKQPHKIFKRRTERTKTKQSLFSGRPSGMHGTLEAELPQH